MPPAIRSGVPADPVDDGEAVEAGGEDTDDVGVAFAVGVWPWWEVVTLAMVALAPATTTTPSAASAGAQPLLRKENPRRGRGSRPRPDPCPSRATRYAMSSTVTRRGGSGVIRCSISASCRSSVFTTPHLRS